MMGKPMVSVLMPYRKKDKFFSLALNSLKNQTYPRLEVLSEEDSNNKGLTVLLNRLASKARGEFLARMDADDISEPDRIEKQVEFLKLNPDVMLVGSWATLIDESGKKIGLQKVPTSWEEIKAQVFHRNPFIHSSWMMRKKWFLKVGGYNEKYRYSQDWEFVLRRVWKDKMVNIPKPLVKLRIHRRSSSFSNNGEQIWCGIKARLNATRIGYIPFWKVLYLAPSLLSMIIPSDLKYRYRKVI